MNQHCWGKVARPEIMAFLCASDTLKHHQVSGSTIAGSSRKEHHFHTGFGDNGISTGGAVLPKKAQMDGWMALCVWGAISPAMLCVHQQPSSEDVLGFWCCPEALVDAQKIRGAQSLTPPPVLGSLSHGQLVLEDRSPAASLLSRVAASKGNTTPWSTISSQQGLGLP